MERPAALLSNRQVHAEEISPRFYRGVPWKTCCKYADIRFFGFPGISTDLDIETGMHKVQYLGPEKRLIYIIDYQFIDDAEHGREVRHFAPDLSCPQY